MCCKGFMCVIGELWGCYRGVMGVIGELWAL